ncbi:rhomboid family intramembrane serine protease [Mucilaginibacter gotjawali]|uniref:Rhomboid-like protein n=1 Tax=Mucilaginibacter gotjawali TaxID=1550579 RepID=A0A839S9L9_9SPHI|nr:rhomboid family intramembrane serine protease [Mucilaginibacter gotjawali]MBB3054695.1 rhomboid-like protein [Mucilaginibacter gotjawali]
MSPQRQSPFDNLTPVVKNLLIINIICFLPFLVLDHSDPRGPYTTLMGGFYFNSPNFKPWQPITYMFMHGGWQHILFNMFALFMFGPILEYAIGAKKFLNLYFICGIGAYVLQMLVQAIEVHNLIGSFTIAQPSLDASYLQFGDRAQALHDLYFGPLVGASGAIFGVLVAFAMLYPELELMILFVPVPIKAKYLIPVYILIELVSGFGQFTGDNVAHFAHLGGALLGFIMIKVWRYR